MTFRSFKNWKLNENEIEGVTVLYPGGFKPMTGGHLDLIKRYASHPDVGLIKVLVGPGIRDGIDQTKAYKIATRLTKDIDNVVVEPVKWPSPVLTAYKEIEQAQPGDYALAASSKGDDYTLVKEFIRKHGPEGKYTPKEGINVIELSLEVDPLTFVGRNDENEGDPISATILRNDIVNDDMENFVAGYPDSSSEDIDFIWAELAETVMNESLKDQPIK